eukprot:scaffold17957_cov122-Isochrysis_galbana.AAC.3
MVEMLMGSRKQKGRPLLRPRRLPPSAHLFTHTRTYARPVVVRRALRVPGPGRARCRERVGACASCYRLGRK